ncbi:NACHT domain-containing protein [uncultured Methylobacterium sp.]|jgi:hypothetical protein|uniref:NACHT domain-containing protein n=1 Tax=uncultured Methylobacterium sp. TaxID=157278 RepID=UPI00262BCEE1|nr:NACHT domain-containing protein [uncultured Methylobacterium sp.]
MEFTPKLLQDAVRNLFQMNNYEVREKVEVHGSEVDLIAKSKSDPFAPSIYVEVTVEYVDNTKYGKDLTKFELVRRLDPGCICLSVSSSGFTGPVLERGLNTGIQLKTYDQIFRSFEKFSPYIEKIVNDAELGKFVEAYEEPFFDDKQGRIKATDWIVKWIDNEIDAPPWIIILGEYGTGKTALTRVLQSRLVARYMTLPNQPLPIRIELRDFSRQFDARTLLHNFLDRNGISYIPIEFLLHLINTKRVFLILDGYDEMAQFLNPRERRACLGALADLASGGAKGLLTSRPNYFSDNEELHVFEALYKNLTEEGYYLSGSDRAYMQSEMNIDWLLQRYILERYERYLRDLNEEQTASLVNRKLIHDPVGQEVVSSILKRVFREQDDGGRSSLAGKPVIISYLLELVDIFKHSIKSYDTEKLSEWTVYRMIVDQLMIRDQHRTPGISPSKRRSCLHILAANLSQRENTVANDETFYNIINVEFRSELRQLEPEPKLIRRNELFDNLRSSSTLTRSEEQPSSGWRFSHNSLREYLVAEMYVNSVKTGKFSEITTPITSAMRQFVKSLDVGFVDDFIARIGAVWQSRSSRRHIGLYLTLYWDALTKISHADASEMQKLFKFMGETLKFDHVTLRGIYFERVLFAKNADFSSSDLSEIRFHGVDLGGSDFSSAYLDACAFKACNLAACSFKGALIYECEFFESSVSGSDFRNLAERPSIFVGSVENNRYLTGDVALGWLGYNGGFVDEIDDYYVYMHHPKFEIILKICEKLCEQRNRQVRGLTQRGEAQKDPPLARDFVQLLRRLKWVDDNREMISINSEGRKFLPEFISENKMPSQVKEFLETRR